MSRYFTGNSSAARRGLSRHLGLVTFSWLALSTLHAADVGAAMFMLEPRLALDTTLESNPRQRADGGDGAVGVGVEIGARAKYMTPRLELILTPKLITRRYAGADGLSRNDRSIAASVSHAFEYWRASADADWIRDSSLTSELDSTGRVDGNTQRTRRSFEPKVEIDLTPTNRLSLLGAFSDVRYERNATSDLLDYSYVTTGASLEHMLSESTKVSATILGSRFKVTERDARTDTVTVRVDGQHAINGMTDVSAGIGIARSKGRGTMGARGQRSDKDVLLDLSLERRFERTTVTVRGARILLPTADGVLIGRDELEVKSHYRLDEYSRVSADARVLRTRPPAGSSASEREVFRVGLGYRRRLTPEWTLRTRYQFRNSSTAQSSSDADAHTFLLRLEFQGEGWAMSQ